MLGSSIQKCGAAKAPSWVQVTALGQDGDPCTMAIPVQLPHKLLEFLIEDCKLTIPTDLVRNYWDHLDSVQDQYAATTKRFRDANSRLIWPVGLHGDEASLGLQQDQTQVYGFFLNIPLFRPTATRMSRWLLWSLESTRVLSAEDTIYPLLREIVASLNRATTAGVSGRRFLVTELRGDQAWFRLIFNHASHWVSHNVCYRCRATAKPTSDNYAIYDCPAPARSTEDFIKEELPATGELCYLAATRPSLPRQTVLKCRAPSRSRSGKPAARC